MTRKHHPSPANRPQARPTKCVPRITSTIISAVRRGLSYKKAAQLGGIAPTTFFNWRRRAEAELSRVQQTKGARIKKSEQPYVDFFEELEMANIQGELALANRIYESAMAGDWRAAERILKMRHAEDWNDNAELWDEIQKIKGHLGIDDNHQK